MTTFFRAVSWGFQYTNAFLQINTVKEYIQFFQKGMDVNDSANMKESIAYSAQNAMEEEIAQHIRISDKLAKQELYEYLTGWIEYFEISLANPERIEKEIHSYNQTRIIEYEALVKEREEKFRQTDHYKNLNHLDFYEVQNRIGLIGGFFQKASYANPNRLEQYRKFFEAPDPDLIDVECLPKYLELIKPIISRCVVIAHKRLSYLKGENEKKQLPESEAHLITPVPESPFSNRLRVSLNAEQLAVLMRLLHDCDVVISGKGEIHKFVADHIQTIGMSEKRISPQNFGKLFSSKKADVINFWIARLTKMIEEAKKK
jgi:hypothetical protein